MFSSTKPSVSSVMGAQRGLGTRLGRPVRCELDIELFMYLFGIFIQAGSMAQLLGPLGT